jgi:hypothetical protein
LEEAKHLAAEWEALPERDRPTFPLGRAIALPQVPAESVPATSEGADFAKQFSAFLDRWGLQGMATWDLPKPQGPLIPNDLPPGSPALPAHGLHIFLPLHYPLQGDDDLHRQILQQQQLLVRDLGLHPSMAGLPHHKAYGQILEVIHWEQTVVDRHGRGSRPRDFMSQLELAMAETLGVGIDLIQKLRKAVACCRKGQRAAVKWLKPRNR